MTTVFSLLRLIFLVTAITLSSRKASSRSTIFVTGFSLNGLVFRGLLHHRHDLARSALLSSFADPSNSQFGRQDYWNKVYQQEANFSWYAGFKDLEPFLEEFLGSKDSHVLLPGVGNDGATLVGMYDAGYAHLSAMDYAAEGIERCREMLGTNRLIQDDRNSSSSGGVDLVVADARTLQGVFDTHSFDAVFEKGTLDAIYLSGGRDKEMCNRYLNMAISELARTLKPGGVWISLAAVVVDQIQDSFQERDWIALVLKDDFYTTVDGYTSNNIDGTLLVWKKRQ
jgi:Methyltransferase domain